MNYISTYQSPKDRVRLCYRRTCIEAKGDNAKLIAGACAVMLLLVGIAALSKAA